MNGMSVIFTDDLNDLRARLAEAFDRLESAQHAAHLALAHHTADWQRAEDALVAAGVEMFEHGDHLTIEDGIARLARDRDNARADLAAADTEATSLLGAMMQHAGVSDGWAMLDSVAGKISQINNMVAGLRAELERARGELRARLDQATKVKDDSNE